MRFGHILNAHQNKWNLVNNFFFLLVGAWLGWIQSYLS